MNRSSARSALRSAQGWIAATVALAAGTLAFTGVAQAEFGIQPGSFQADVSTLQAGAHPDATTSFNFNLTPGGAPDGSVRDVNVDLPPGLVGNPTAAAECDSGLITQASVVNGVSCPRNTMVGVANLTLVLAGIPFPIPVTTPVFNLKPYADEPAAFGFNVGQFATVRLDAGVATDSDYHLKVSIEHVHQALALVSSRLTLWGVPADHNGAGPNSLSAPPYSYGGPGDGERLPFMTNAFECGRPDSAELAVRSYADPSTWLSYTSDPRTLTGCDRLQFEPTLDVQPVSQRAGEPSGYAVDLAIPQNDNPDGLATPSLRDATVVMPQGVTVSPSATSGNGLQGCTDEQVGLHSNADPACPQASQIGTVRIDTPLMSKPLTGNIFLGQPKSNDSQTGQMLRIFLVAANAGVTIKLEGNITPDPRIGQLTAVFANNPELPFNELRLQFQGGPRAPLTNPQQCGTYTTTSTLTAWSGNVANPQSSFNITQDANGSACQPLGFSPSFQAGTVNPAGGKSSTFALTFGRDDTQQDFGDVSVNLPEGLTGVIAQTTPCADANAALGACDASARIGTATVGSGAGTNPVYLSGPVYLTEGYKGGAFGLSIVVPAKAGPFDLGTVIVRAAVFVDNSTTALRIVSDSLPAILQGIPLRLRTVNVAIDRPGFMLNPTDCSAAQVAGSISSVAGAIANVAARFRAASCAALRFGPKMTLRAGSRGHTKHGVTTPLTVGLTMPAGQANNRVISVNLPKTLNAELNVVSVRNSCSPTQYQADQCPLQVGTATAVTPLLRDPLVGRVFLVRTGGRLPDMLVRLRGQGDGRLIDIDLDGKIAIPKDLTLRTTFDTVPDVPITSFKLNLVSGRNAPVGVASNLCTVRARKGSVAKLSFTAQNGTKVTRNQKVTI
ncbi:MAG TPA: hypothetical protein VGM91_15330, partial [Conexibacter sp.]